ncbi:MAG: sensor histidine kinase [Propionibacteriaceae bacterium]|uniref:histidine kinase n=1 Tax=Propionibacterium ruminifibrarum TaxID=1962131 RepID=A0A375I754_9ACTN|nr:histidine kinase [Propionibacterium ruminifibrarum]MBE6477566.1 sensor histidine kinase [Propionibacteriaceae bacterium]SPF69361.1 Histidine kinase [Propionibacterium ruminifibrarum]
MVEQSLPERFGAWLGLDDDWQRPVQHVDRRDVAVTLVMAAALALNLELLRGYYPAEAMEPRPLEYGLIVLLALPLLWRRRLPLVCAMAVFAAFVVARSTADEVAAQLVGQVLLFLAVFSAACWARNRRALAATVTGILLADLLWLTWDFAVGLSTEHIIASLDGPARGLLSPAVSYGIYAYLINIVFFVSAFVFGTSAWRRARQQAKLAAQATQLARQSEQLRDQAIIEERLRIARELHDVVAHHVSVTGVQAAAARRALDRRPDQAARALGMVEESSREAIGQMRGLLGALRGAAGHEDDSRQASPTIAQITGLTTGRADGLRVDYELLEPTPGAATQVPLPVALSIYRTVEEALTNVRRHSTARSAQVVVRVAEHYVETEILDAGRPVPGTSGTGLGQLGMRERAAHHHGEVEIGPRPTGGYRVRVRLPLMESQ